LLVGTTQLVLSGGNVGIGTANPSAKLHVGGGTRFGVTDVGSIFLQSGTGTDGRARDWKIYSSMEDPGGNLAFRDMGFDNLDNGMADDALVIQPVTGNVGIGMNNPQSRLHVNGTVTATAFNPSSDRNLKENFAPVNPRDVLDKVTGLQISRWNFIADNTTPHVGPMAQDFHAAFGLGTDERHIATVDADGVALAAIQGLNQKVDFRNQKSEDRIQKLEAENVELKQSVNELKELVGKLSRKLEGSAK
jgi:hypothetical protein